MNVVNMKGLTQMYFPKKNPRNVNLQQMLFGTTLFVHANTKLYFGLFKYISIIVSDFLVDQL